MQNRYVCDFADFGKYGLLRQLTRPDPKTDTTDLKLGIVWYAHPDERHGNNPNKINRDGKNTAYLENTPENRRIFGRCDLPLWNKLGCLLREDMRCMHCIERANLFSGCTKFFGSMLYFLAHMRPEMREAIREAWLSAALARVKNVDIVYLDPDTGIAQDESKMYGKKGPKYTYIGDIQRFWCKGKSVAIYHHLGHANIEEQVRAKAGQLREIPGVEVIIVLRLGSRIFFILPQPCHRARIEARVQRMVTDRLGWGRHFELLGVADV